MLKITSGKYRSRLLEVPPSVTVPSKSIVRTALSNALMDKMEGAAVLDLFAGSGALGIEALSRGAAHADFVDQSFEASHVIGNNLDRLKENNGRVYCLDFMEALKSLHMQSKRYDIVFLDPPYALKESYKESIDYLLKNQMLNDGAAIVAEYEGEIEVPLSQFGSSRTYNYGKSHVLILRR